MGYLNTIAYVFIFGLVAVWVIYCTCISCVQNIPCDVKKRQNGEEYLIDT